MNLNKFVDIEKRSISFGKNHEFDKVRAFEKSLRICKIFLYLRNRKKEKEKTKKAVKPVHTLDRTLGNHMIKIIGYIECRMTRLYRRLRR